MRRFAETAEAIAQTSSRLKKVKILADYLQDLSDTDLRASAMFFTGRPFPLCDDRTLNVGGAALARTILDLGGASEADLHDANLQDADLEGAKLSVADLMRTNLRRANLRNADFWMADMKDTILQGADLQGANLAEVTSLTQKQINSAITNDKTILPAGLRRL